MTEDAKWSVYGIAEDDSCPEEEEQTTTEKQEPKSKDKTIQITYKSTLALSFSEESSNIPKRSCCCFN